MSFPTMPGETMMTKTRSKISAIMFFFTGVPQIDSNIAMMLARPLTYTVRWR